MRHYNANGIWHWTDFETKQNKKTKIAKTKNFTTKTENLNLKAQSNNVTMQSDKNLTTQIYFLLTVDGKFS